MSYDSNSRKRVRKPYVIAYNPTFLNRIDRRFYQESGTDRKKDGMTQFKEGDRVRLTVPEERKDAYFSTNGEVGTVVSNYSISSVRVKRDKNPNMDGYWEKVHCTLIEEKKRMIGKGDKLRLINDFWDCGVLERYRKDIDYLIANDDEGSDGDFGYTAYDKNGVKLASCYLCIKSKQVKPYTELTPYMPNSDEQTILNKQIEEISNKIFNKENTMSTTTKYYRVIKDHAVYEENAIISNEIKSSEYITTDPIFLKEDMAERFEKANKYYYEEALVVENCPELYERVYSIGKLEKAMFGNRKQAQAAAAALFKESK